MAEDPRALAGAVLRIYPRTYGRELGTGPLDRPSGLWRLLVVALLMSARIRASIAGDAARALWRERWTSPRRMADASWEERAAVLNRAGYARYDERTSRLLGDTAALVLDRYRGDLRRLREEAGRDPATERRLLQEFPGIGPVGTDIFCREAQEVWTELRPFADRVAQRAAGRLGLPTDAGDLAALVGPDHLALLVSGLVRTDLDGAYDRVRERAGA